MDYLEWIAKRVAQLRMEKGVSARDMSLSLGQSESYINKIENRKTLPSIQGLLYICEYFSIEPSAFFDQTVKAPAESEELLRLIPMLKAEQARHVIQIIEDILT